VQHPEAGEVELQHARIAHGEDAANEEDEQESSDALCRIRGHAARLGRRLSATPSCPCSNPHTCARCFHLRLLSRVRSNVGKLPTGLHRSWRSPERFGSHPEIFLQTVGNRRLLPRRLRAVCRASPASSTSSCCARSSAVPETA